MTDHQHEQAPGADEPDATLLAQAKYSLTLIFAREAERLLGRELTEAEFERFGPENPAIVAGVQTLETLVHAIVVRDQRRKLGLDPETAKGGSDVMVLGTMLACIQQAPHVHLPGLSFTVARSTLDESEPKPPVFVPRGPSPTDSRN